MTRGVPGLFLAFALIPALASGEVLLASGPTSHGNGFVVRETVELSDWHADASGAKGTINVDSRHDAVSVSFQLICATGKVEWRSNSPEGKATAEGGVVTEVDAHGDLTATFADGDQAFFPPRNGDPDLATIAGFHLEDGYRSRKAGEAWNLEDTGSFLSDHPAIGYSLTMMLYARACPGIGADDGSK